MGNNLTFILPDRDDFVESVRMLSQDFSPFSGIQESQGEEDKRNELSDLLKSSLPNSCFIRLAKGTPFPKPEKKKIPPTPKEVAEMLLTSGVESSPEILIDKLKMSDEERASLEEATRVQSGSSLWKEHRHGRITASNFSRVHSMTQSRSDPKNLVASIMGYKKEVSTTAMKHGLSMEGHAKVMYAKVAKKTHKKFKAENCGIVIHESHPFVSASPDLKVTCQCHGPGLCEIKCPFSIRDQEPSKWKHLDGGSLSKKSPYYFQIQRQMGVAKYKYCDLFVYTAYGYHHEVIHFDHEFWEEIESEIFNFWEGNVAPELLTCKIFNEGYTNQQSLTVDHPYACGEKCPAPSTKVTQQRASGKGPLVLSKLPKIYLCGVCGQDVVEEPNNRDESSIECTDCNMWIHFKCAGIRNEAEPIQDAWLCPSCK